MCIQYMYPHGEPCTWRHVRIPVSIHVRTRKRMKERFVAAVAAILLSFLLHSLNASIACREDMTGV